MALVNELVGIRSSRSWEMIDFHLYSQYEVWRVVFYIVHVQLDSFVGFALWIRFVLKSILEAADKCAAIGLHCNP